jgi:phosphoribosylformylglycinamidine cyclo-ligase
VVLGLASSGAHSNGYSLVRRVIERAHGSLSSPRLRDDFQGRSFADAVMAPTRIYVKPLLALMAHLPVKGLAHITGGGLARERAAGAARRLQAVLYRRRLDDAAAVRLAAAQGQASPTPRCTGCSTAASAWWWWSTPRTRTSDRAAVERGRRAPSARIGEIVDRPAGAAATVVR